MTQCQLITVRLFIDLVTSAWNYSQKSEIKLPQNNKDFRELNKMTVKTGLHTAKVRELET